MTLSFSEHGKGCAPITPCLSCKAIAVLRGALTNPEEKLELDNLLHGIILRGNGTLLEHSGACTPIELCNLCFLASQLKQLVGPTAFEEFGRIVTQTRESASTNVTVDLSTPLQQFAVNGRLIRLLKLNGYEKLEGVVKITEAELKVMPGFGNARRRELKNFLASIGRHLAPTEERK